MRDGLDPIRAQAVEHVVAVAARLEDPVVAVVAIAGNVDLARAVRATPEEHRLGAQWRAARAAEPVLYDAALHPEISANRFYLPCDPPYDWGSEIWYLQEVLRPGAGNEAAAEGGAFRARPGPPCASR